MALGFFKNIVQRFTAKPVDWDELEEMLIRADLGVPMTVRVIARLRQLPSEPTAQTIVEVVKTAILEMLPHENPPLRPHPARPRVIVVVGVNGTGKTTSTAKLAYHLHSRRHSVLLAAADTFRAAAIEQLGIWSERIGVEMIKGQYNADPAALCFDAYQSAQRRNMEFLICDTAGRLHTKDNLMQELAKVKRILGKHDAKAPDECLLVVDATTGSNALVQAKEFHRAIGLTGLIVTKLDGSGKGGIIVSIQEELGIPTRFIGTGEKLEDLAYFDREKYVNAML